jgi:hypothetical protein
METFVLTVLGGVFIFVLGQIVLKLVIDPAQELKRTLGGTSHSLLLHQAQLTNASFDKDIAAEIKLKSAEIVSKSHTVLWYALVRIVFGLPSKKNILSVSRQLNLISYGMLAETKKFEDSPGCNATKTDFALENARAIREAGRLLGLKTTYGNS